MRDRVRFHVGTQEVMARVLLVDRAELEPGQAAFGRFRLEAPVVALPGDRYVIRSYSPIVTIGGGTLLDVAPPRFKRKGPALLAHLTLLRDGRAGGRSGGAPPPGRRGRRAAGRSSGRARRSAPSACAQLLEGCRRGGHRASRSTASGISTATRTTGCAPQTLALLEAFHAENPLRAGISREELRSRAGNAQERVFAQLLGALEAEGVVKSERDQVRLASHAPALARAAARGRRARGRLPPGRRRAAEPGGGAGAGRRQGHEQHELFQVLVADRRSCG